MANVMVCSGGQRTLYVIRSLLALWVPGTEITIKLSSKGLDLMGYPAIPGN